MRRRVVAVALVVAVAPLSACGTHGDCSARIVVGKAIYRSANGLTDLTLAGASLGTGKVIGCGGADARAVDHVAVRAFSGVDRKVAILVLGPPWGGLYVREGLKPADWPPAILASPRG